LIVGERIEQEDRPDKRVFTLTEDGERDLQGWLDEPLMLQIGRSPLFLRYLVLSLVRPTERAAFLLQQRRRVLDDIGRLVNDRAEDADGAEAGDSPTAALRELAIAHAEADLRWIEWLESK
jgi:DNA-binding PadR family transcriptional regulator